MTENEAKIFIQNAMEQSKNVLAELMLIMPKVFAVRKKNLGEYYSNLENCKKEIQSCEVAIKALEEVQKYRTIEKDLKERYHANVDIPLLMHHFIETVFEGEKHEGFCLLTNEDREAWEEYKAIGTPEECQKSVEICKSMIERNITPENMEEYMKFEDECVKNGFTFNSLLEAREKQIPYKPSQQKLVWGIGKCKCGVEFLDRKTGFCGNCGQKLDWSDEQ
jgi:hypothetical protein